VEQALVSIDRQAMTYLSARISQREKWALIDLTWELIRVWKTLSLDSLSSLEINWVVWLD